MKSKLKKFLASIIILSIILNITLFVPSTYAATHSCEYEKIRISYTYSANVYDHVTETYFHYECWCGNEYDGPTSIIVTSHSFGQEYYSNNYHSGAYHYYQYSKYCWPCGLTLVTRTERALCNGNCRTPM